MKLFLPSNTKLWRHGHGIFRVLRPLFFSTNTLTSSSSSSSSSSSPVDVLFGRISRAGDPKFSIVPLLEQWLEGGNHIKLNKLKSYIKQLRKYRRFSHALEISQWMSDRREYKLSAGDIAIRLDLISKVHGVEQAEKYFNSIPDALRGLHVYGALLNCYTFNKCLDEAEATFQKMEELGFVKNPLPYNLMLRLYSQMGKHEKLDVLMQKMDGSGINCDGFTFNTTLNAYVATSNIKEMTELLMMMEADPKIKIDWHACVVAANGYLKAGLIDNALTMLKRSEQLVEANSRRSAYEIFLTSYAAAGNKDELYRIWSLYKNMGRVFNSGYACMINSLMKLDDIDGAERILEEWESGKTLFDIRIPHMMISAYSKKGLWEKAEAYVNKIVESGMELNARTWDHLAAGYHISGQMEKAVETIKKAISISKPGWKPNVFTMAACFEYLKGQGDVEVAEEVLNLLGEHCHFSTDVFHRLKNFISDGNMSIRALDLLEGGDEPINGEKPAVTEFENRVALDYDPI